MSGLYTLTIAQMIGSHSLPPLPSITKVMSYCISLVREKIKIQMKYSSYLMYVAFAP